MTLEIRDLEVSFRDLETPALAIPALDIGEGEHVAVTGASGSGKTTFVNVVSGLEPVRRGRVAWRGIDLAGLGEGQRERWRAQTIGLVMQDFHLFAGLGVIDNILLPTRLHSRRRAAALAGDATELMRRVGLGRPHQRIETLSRGEMQRVAIARALVHRPGTIIADEPSASLDPANGEAVGALLTELAADLGSTLIVVTHDGRLASRMQRKITLQNGKIA